MKKLAQFVVLLVGVVLLTFAIFTPASAQSPSVMGKTIRLGHVDGGTLPTPVVGGVVYDVIGNKVLISDGGSWAACN